MSDTPHKTSRDNATGSSGSGLSQSGDLSGISEMFGLRDGQQAGSESGTRLVRRSDWQSVGLPSGDTGTRTGTDTVGRWVAATSGEGLAPADASGRLVQGRYRLIAELGFGGMGVTYRAWDTTTGIPVVVKMPRREVRTDSEAMQRFAREIDAMLAVPHESIVPITDHGDDDGCPFVVMQFLPGGSLADYRRRAEAGSAIRNPPGMLHYWLPGVAAALDHIHSKGMLHRDVKPGNIFLDGFLKPYLGDFGIAKVVDESGGLAKEQTLTATKMAVGTPEYMAPELFKPRSKPDGRVDQYALAVTVYEMLSGEKPFKGDRAHIIVEHSGLPVPPLSGKVPSLPQSLCTAVEKGLAKKSEDRFGSCSEFAEAVLGELAVLPPESDTVRLLCPGCKNILKLPQKAAGQTGRCPRCREAIDVAADLGSLWLEAEERGGGTAAGSQADLPPATFAEASTEARPRWRWGIEEWVAVALAAGCGLVLGYPWGMLVNAAKSGREFREAESVWQTERAELGKSQNSLVAEKLLSSDEIGKLQASLLHTKASLLSAGENADRLKTERDALQTERDVLKTETRRLLDMIREMRDQASPQKRPTGSTSTGGNSKPDAAGVPPARQPLPRASIEKDFEWDGKVYRFKEAGKMQITEKLVGKWPEGEHWPDGLAFHPDGRIVASGGGGTTDGMFIDFWSMASPRKPLVELRHSFRREVDLEENGFLSFFDGTTAIGADGTCYFSLGSCSPNALYKVRSKSPVQLEKLYSIENSTSALQIPACDEKHLYSLEGQEVVRYPISSLDGGRGDVWFRQVDRGHFSGVLIVNEHTILASFSGESFLLDKRQSEMSRLDVDLRGPMAISWDGKRMIRFDTASRSLFEVTIEPR